MNPGGTRYSFVINSWLCSLSGIIETAYGSALTFRPAASTNAMMPPMGAIATFKRIKEAHFMEPNME